MEFPFLFDDARSLFETFYFDEIVGRGIDLPILSPQQHAPRRRQVSATS